MMEYPQKLADQKRLLPDFIIKNREFMEGFFKAQGLKGRTLADALARGGARASFRRLSDLSRRPQAPERRGPHPGLLQCNV
jgi:hypothetical protein